MRRIDENTFIDSTLVICAEYQLFIDEMCDQGKYYQPDHWTSYQFSKGKAREPVLGVRHSDAIAFCTWLTNKEGKEEWKYRLPTQEEARAFPLKPVEKKTLGYWIIGDDQFFWVGTIHENARALAFSNILDRDHVHARVRALNRARARALDHAYDCFHKISERSYDFDLAFTKALDRANNLALHLDLTLDRTSNDSLSRAINRDLNLNRDLDIGFDQNLDLGLALDTYIDIFTISERIAGRSPAFEGIRLVKERIK